MSDDLRQILVDMIYFTDMYVNKEITSQQLLTWTCFPRCPEMRSLQDCWMSEMKDFPMWKYFVQKLPFFGQVLSYE